MTPKELLTMTVDGNTTLRDVFVTCDMEGQLTNNGYLGDEATLLRAAETLLESLRAAGVKI